MRKDLGSEKGDMSSVHFVGNQPDASCEESSWSIGAEFRATARLLNNCSNMVIAHAYESPCAAEGKHTLTF
jgi:hypothetical protein